jgi:hypothetical protein
MDLINKPPDDDDLPLPKPWEERPISYARWRKHRETMMKWAHPGHRPREWWNYELQKPVPSRETIWLFEHDELTEAELAELMPHWREKFERAQEPGFAYCIGHAKPDDTFASWLEGAAARRAHYRFWEIPLAILKQWNAERCRSMKAVRPKSPRRACRMPMKVPIPRSDDLLSCLKEALTPDRLPLLIAIDGADNAGKSSLASWLAWQLGMPAVQLDLYLTSLRPIQWLTDDLARVVARRMDRDRPLIIDGVLALDALDRIGHAASFLVFVSGGHSGSTLAPQIAAYKLRRKLPEQANFIIGGYTD